MASTVSLRGLAFDFIPFSPCLSFRHCGSEIAMPLPPIQNPLIALIEIAKRANYPSRHKGWNHV